MITTRRPRSHAERSEVLDALGPLDPSAGLHPVVAAIVIATFAAVRKTYETDLALVLTASVKVATLRTVKNEADIAFNTAFRLWEATVLDAQGKSLTGGVAIVLGATPSAFLDRKPRIKLEVMRKALPRFTEMPALTGDPARLAALADATAVLGTAVVAWEAALRARKDLVGRLVEATAAFDIAYVALAEAMLTYDPEAKSKLPEFHRAGPDASTDADEEDLDPSDELEPEPEPEASDPPYGAV